MRTTHATVTEKADPKPTLDREALILQHLNIVKFLARRLRTRVPARVTLDDLVSAGTIGLVHAADRYEPARGLTFAAYARHRVWGSMLDFLRGEDPLSRTERGRYLEARPVTVSLNLIPDIDVFTRPAPPFRESADFALRADLNNLRTVLSARENRVLTLLFEEGLSNGDVALQFHVNESRISQIKHAALAKLRSRLP